jgi:hypothetical protein
MSINDREWGPTIPSGSEPGEIEFEKPTHPTHRNHPGSDHRPEKKKELVRHPYGESEDEAIQDKDIENLEKYEKSHNRSKK